MTTEVQCKICLTLHQWSHPRWGTLLPCCPVNTSAPRFSCRTAAAISHVLALLPTICFDQFLIAFVKLWRQHSPSISDVLHWTGGSCLIRQNGACLPCVHSIMRSGYQHTFCTLSSLFPSGKRYRSHIQKPAGTRRASFPSLSWRADKLGHLHSGHSPTSPNKDIIILPVYLSLAFYYYYFIISCHVYLANHIFNVYLSWILCLICILVSLMYSLCLYITLCLLEYIPMCVYVEYIEAQQVTSHRFLGYVNILGI